MLERKKITSYFVVAIYVVLFFAILANAYVIYEKNQEVFPANTLITSASAYQDDSLSIKEQLRHRLQLQPFNAVSLIIFMIAIAHTFLVHKFNALASKLQQERKKQHQDPAESFTIEFLHFMGETEVVFGLWVIPLLWSMMAFYDWQTALHYLNTRNYTEPLFVVVMMALASTKPVIEVAKSVLKKIAHIGGGSTKAWWFVILTVGPLLGSFITEPAAMTICAVLLIQQFYSLKPTSKMAYATLALLFTNISVGGVLTNFAAPPVLMVSRTWGWSSEFMFFTFGIKAVAGIILCNLFYFLLCRKEFAILDEERKKQRVEKAKNEVTIPLWITCTHLLFLVWCIVHAHYPVMFIAAFLVFLGFYEATKSYQFELELRSPILVGFFLAGLIVHGSLQSWWISPLLSKTNEEILLLFSTILTSFNDNAAITYMASSIPDFKESLKIAVVSGAVVGGGLTVIANAPNPAGQSLLKGYFDNGISALLLLFAALPLCLIMLLCFYFL